MNKQEMAKALAIAKDPDRVLSDRSLDLFYGFGLIGFGPVHCTCEGVARLLRWQAEQFNGSWDSVEINDIARIGRQKFIIIG